MSITTRKHNSHVTEGKKKKEEKKSQPAVDTDQCLNITISNSDGQLSRS